MGPEDHTWDDWMDAAVLPALGLTVGQVKTCREHFLDYLHDLDPFTVELRDDVVLSGEHPRCFLGEGELEDLLERVCSDLGVPISYRALKLGAWWRDSPTHSLAFAMASHPRLGKECVFRELPRDVLEKIVKSWVEPWAAFKRDHTFQSFLKIVARQFAAQPLDPSDVKRDWILQRCKTCQKWRRRNQAEPQHDGYLEAFSCEEIGRQCAEEEREDEDKAERWWRKRWWRLEGNNDLADEDSDGEGEEDRNFVLHDSESEGEEEGDEDEENQGDEEREEGEEEEEEEEHLAAAAVSPPRAVEQAATPAEEAGGAAHSSAPAADQGQQQAAAAAEEEGSTSTSCAAESREQAHSGEEDGWSKPGQLMEQVLASAQGGLSLQALVSSSDDDDDEVEEEQWEEEEEVEPVPATFAFALSPPAPDGEQPDAAWRLRHGGSEHAPDRRCLTIKPDSPRVSQLLRSRLRTATAIHRIGPTALRCMLRRAGVSRCSHAVYDYARWLLKGLLQEALFAALRYAEHGNRLTVTVGDVVAGLEVLGKKVYGTGFAREQGQVERLGNTVFLHDLQEPRQQPIQLPPPPAGVVQGGGWSRQGSVLRCIKRQQRLPAATSLAVPKARFQQLVRQLVWECPEVAAGAAEQVRVQASALAALQEVAEERVVLVCKDALSCCVYARSTALLPDDLRFAYLGMAQRSHY